MNQKRNCTGVLLVINFSLMFGCAGTVSSPEQQLAEVDFQLDTLDFSGGRESACDDLRAVCALASELCHGRTYRHNQQECDSIQSRCRVSLQTYCSAEASDDTSDAGVGATEDAGPGVDASTSVDASAGSDDPTVDAGSSASDAATVVPAGRPGELLISDAELQALPTSGRAWDRLKAAADSAWGPVDLADQDNRTGTLVLAGALVYARTRQQSYRDKVIAALRQVPSSPLDRVLSLGRQLGGYVLAADLVDYREASFVAYVDDIRTRDIGGHGRWVALTQCAENTASNWGAFARASRLAASLYLGDTQDVAREAEIFYRFLGDTSIDHTFQTTAAFDASWVCDDGGAWSPINPVDCGATKDGAIVEDISRGPSYPDAADAGIGYSTETMQGVIVEALLLERAGYTDVWQAEDQAILRAASFLDRNNAWPGEYSVEHHITWVINHVYGTNMPTEDAGKGRLFGWTDWLYGTKR